ncbi:MAG TPA: cation diffusion facilitator family transporter [Propionicimonas sp.]
MDAEPTTTAKPRPDLRRFAWLSIGAAIATIVLKSGAYLLTGSVGLLSDAAESIVNLVAAVVALVALSIAAQPFDEEHHFGHGKAEYFSAAIEGIMIFVAAGFILWTSVQRFLSPAPLENVGIGLGISIAASAINGVVAVILTRTGRSHRSITLIADGKHLMTDVWTSAGVVVGVLLVALTGWLRLDPIIAFLVGCNIIWTGWHLIAQSVDGLMDRAMSVEEHDRLLEILNGLASDQVQFHSVQTRAAGHTRFISMHVLLPGAWNIQRGHHFVEEVEHRVVSEFEHAQVFTHMEPIEDPRSYEDDLPGLTPGNATPDTPGQAQVARTEV